MDRLVFNHHSLPFNHRNAAEEAIPGFIKTCIEASNAGLKTILLVDSLDTSWFRLELVRGYCWQDWYNQHKEEAGNRESVQAFRSIATKSLLLNSDDLTDGADLFEVTFENRKDYVALRAVAWHEVPVTSFTTREPWDSLSVLPVTVTRMNPETEDIEDKEYEIQNFYNYSVFQQYLPELRKQRDDALSSGREIFKQFKNVYPRLVLCDKAEQQLKNWSASVGILAQVKKSFSMLNQFVERWQGGEFSHYSSQFLGASGISSFRVSGESESVRKNPGLSRKREFRLPSGRKEYFEQHIKMPTGYRLHFYPDSGERKIYVGYIGPHLKTK